MIAAAETIASVKETIVDFYGDPIIAIQHEDGISVSLRRVCECIGVDLSTQLAKLKDRHWATIGQCPTVASDGLIRDQSVISLRSLPMWLSTINAKHVAPEIRSKLERYQLECHDALAAYFFSPEKEMPTHAGRKVRVDYTNEVFGNWTITGPTDTRRWHIQCDCGHQQTAFIYNVKTGCRCHACGTSSRHAWSSPKPATVSSNSYVQVIRDYANSIDAMLAKRIAFLALPDPQTLLTHGAPQT